MSPDRYSKEAVVWEHVDTAIHTHADGTGERVTHVVARVQSDGAARQLSVIVLPYASAYQQATIEYVRVKKPHGEVVETPATDAVDQPSPVTTEAPLYSDLKQKQIPVRSLAAGDELEYQMRTVTTKAEVPGEFWGAEHFLNNNGVVLSQTLTLSAPVGTAVKVWSPKHPAVETTKDELHTWTWASAQLKPTPAAGVNAPAGEKIEDPDEDAEGRALPSVAWTTFRSWNELGDWYRSLAQPRSEPTVAIVNRANELTKDAKTPDEQVRALYDFVSEHIRYVGIDFGVGRYQPHSADEVLTNQYGDCKDKDTLLEALLRAKGFTTAPVLIGAGIQPVEDLPSPALFNHVITTVMVQGSRVWLDSTPGAEPYRELVPAIRDEQALVVAKGAATLEKTPADPPFSYTERFEAVGTLDADGLLKSRMTLTLRSDAEYGFRIMINQVAPSQWDQAMQAVSQAIGFGGTVSNTDFRQSDPNGPVRVSYDYTRPSFGDWENHRILPLFPVLDITWIERDHAPEYDIDLGVPRRIEAVTRIALPGDYVPTLPDAIHVKRDYTTFDQTYRLEKRELVVERTVVVLKKKVPKADWKDYYAFMKAIGYESGENYIVLETPFRNLPEVGAATTASHDEAKDGKADKSGAERAQGDYAMHASMLKSALEMEHESKWDVAESLLEAVKGQDDRYPYVMSMLGSIAWHQGKLEEAIADYELEVQHNPLIVSNVVAQLGTLYLTQKRYADAEKLAKRFVERNDAVIYVVLVNAQIGAGEKNEALKTAKTASEGNPTDRALKLEYVKALHGAGHDDEALATVTAWMKEETDPDRLNAVAWLLVEEKFGLAKAEELSRRSIAKEEAALNAVTVDDADEKSNAECSVLMSSWDTLGWILYREGKTAESESYIQAAWVGRRNLVIGMHLGEVLEALGRKGEALSQDGMMLGMAKLQGDASSQDELKLRIEKLHAEHVAERMMPMSSMVSVPRAADAAGSAVMMVAVKGGAIEDLRRQSGDGGLGGVVAAVKGRKLSGVEPAGSQARIFFEGNLNCVKGVPTCEMTLMPPARSN
ncbi:DUF3857 domain-containing protein [Silvibacterium sp.]|uniref:DUF3857 domain-containing protein n=1 Tax=Silvibacterium sp. TaxID=1964179 RepID=UPI0039E36CF8